MTISPFRKILIANRGEIALRIIKTARRLGYETVAVFSEADVEALHVRAADEACFIGGALPAQSYLRIEAIVAAAKGSGADAIHPGYGFLAESAQFAAACAKAGLIFIGPSPDAIRALGDKAKAKAIMQSAGVACVPGYQGEEQTEARLCAEAERLGFPIMIKASAGGGGRGMRMARDAKSFLDLLHSARSEALHAFGDETLLLERAIEAPRHIEIQVFGDRYGNALHLGERDCSVQRRHQKLIEEAPSPAVSADLRRRMGAAAVAAVKATAYEGAGTLEFLVDPAGDFFFMEMNTRLQVEHPVTEAITDLDLVELQLRIASGEPLPLRQEDVVFSGHAMEVRLCAEDPEQDFLPQSGRVALWRPAPGLRVDTALESGTEVAPFYDSMIAKIIAHGASREEARRKLRAGLEETVALGINTNLSFLLRCLDHETFAAGAATTAFIESYKSDLLHHTDGARARLDAVVAAALYVTENVDEFRPSRGLVPDFARPMRFMCAGREVELELRRRRNGSFEARVAGRTFELEIEAVTRDVLQFRTETLRDKATYVRAGFDLFLSYRGQSFHVRDHTLEVARKGSAAASDGRLRAAMSGRVVAVFVKQGDRVELGQPIVTLEAMKMEHVHTAPIAGIVSILHVGENEQVATNKIVAEIEASAAVAA
ncbi:MAG: acetyl-CoA carboxylase biotin carboxylase subunit [Beijerinckiaceae bacterium]